MRTTRRTDTLPHDGLSASIGRHSLGIGIALLMVGWLLALSAVFPKSGQRTHTGFLVVESPGEKTFVFVMLDQDVSSFSETHLSLVPLESSGDFGVAVGTGNETIALPSDQQLDLSLASYELTITVPEGARIVYRYELVFSFQGYHPSTDIFIALGGLLLSVAGLYLASGPVMARFRKEMKNKNRGRGMSPPP